MNPDSDLRPEELPEGLCEDEEIVEAELVAPELVAPEGFSSLVENGLDFLEHAISELKTHPKYSVIHFSTGIELLLKARLLHEHWSLLVVKPGSVTKKEFLSGEFESVTLAQCLDRLEKVADEPLAEERRHFLALAPHRNRAIHFFHELYNDKTKAQMLQHIAIQQLRAGALLMRLLRERWKSQFNQFADEFDIVEHLLRGHDQYLKEKLELVTPQLRELKAAGALIRNCSFCKLLAAHITDNGSPSVTERCLVCEWVCDHIVVPCPDCGKGQIDFDAGSGVCNECDAEFDLAFLVERFGKPQAYCPNCSYSDESVIPHGDGYLCLACGLDYDRIGRCQWCGEDVAGDLSDSYLAGCMFCAGLIGHERDD